MVHGSGTWHIVKVHGTEYMVVYQIGIQRVTTSYLAVQADSSLVPHDDRHPLADIVEVEDTEELVDLLHPQGLDRDGPAGGGRQHG